MHGRILQTILCCWAVAILGGCTSVRTSNTARTGTEQLLISNAVDQALNKVEFTSFQGTTVYLDDKFVDCVDKSYVVGAVRHRLLNEGISIAAKPEDADVVVELRSGGVGTDTSESFVGIPSLTLPGMISLPEVRLLTRSNQTGTAKLGLVAYEAKTKRVLGAGGTAIARSDDNNWYVLGVGPYQNGSLHRELEREAPLSVLPGVTNVMPQIAFDRPKPNATSSPTSGRVQLTSEEVPQ